MDKIFIVLQILLGLPEVSGFNSSPVFLSNGNVNFVCHAHGLWKRALVLATTYFGSNVLKCCLGVLVFEFDFYATKTM